ncbi:acetaldehyde dehydrogenase (acetylating) [Phytoactinopolyspora endophytica]|uniref:acetaldehyde dehydrogenase (acetylating) n=1 Tax=Phytoactinopolyspora endophytica TaxID=1642495 RepID=UPI00101CE435|nr:acetaldehyde dehydrogenase (acetylating) [Phytoactinopolyspora endophytica]
MKTKAAIIGSGNIGTDLMFKMMRLSEALEPAALVGIDPESDGLSRAGRLGIPTTADGVAGLTAMPGFDDVEIVFDATSARAHVANDAALRPLGRRIVDLTPAAIGPYVVPSVNLEDHHAAPNVNMVTCGGQATIPIVAAVSAVTAVHYAEIVAAISSRSAGPGTRANIDEFTRTTRAAIERIGGAQRAKAIIILNPADPPLIMRDTVHCLVSPDGTEIEKRIRSAVTAMVGQVAAYVPGYRLKQEVQFVPRPAGHGLRTLADEPGELLQVSVFLEVEGAAHYLPAYAGNLDIMTSAALQVGERIARSGAGTAVPA